ncbi:MAG TPA: hypothetical protein VLY87_06790, partial [Flavobacterium sp.]|nr:hypothetical protein [Flavobacterium sp.]
MRYFKAFEIAVKPLIQWDCFANSEAEYMELGLNTDHLVIREEDIPENQYGVCPLKIVDGQLFNRAPSEMESYESEYNSTQAANMYKSQITTINNNTFNHQEQVFFMDEVTRIAIEAVSSSQQELTLRVRTQSGYYTLNNGNIIGVKQAYHNRLQ